jgi:hypothetical protein
VAKEGDEIRSGARAVLPLPADLGIGGNERGMRTIGWFGGFGVNRPEETVENNFPD